MEHIKKLIIVFIGLFTSFLGGACVPILIMVCSNILDYITGIFASPYRKQEINSYKGIRGITKKVTMWLLVVVGALLDKTIIYISELLPNVSLNFNFAIACIVAVWITVNEIISILENIIDIGVPVPKFMVTITKYIKKQVEESTELEEKENEKNE